MGLRYQRSLSHRQSLRYSEFLFTEKRAEFKRTVEELNWKQENVTWIETNETKSVPNLNTLIFNKWAKLIPNKQYSDTPNIFYVIKGKFPNILINFKKQINSTHKEATIKLHSIKQITKKQKHLIGEFRVLYKQEQANNLETTI